MRALILLVLMMPVAAWATKPEEGRRGFVDDEAIYKWSGQVLEKGGWVIGLRTVAYGLDDSVTVAVESGNLLLGHYNARGRGALVRRRGLDVSIDGGLGVVTPLALARLAVPGAWRNRQTLFVIDLGVPATWQLRPGRFLTVRPALGAASGSVDEDDVRLPSLLGRASLTGPSVAVTAEAHLADRIGLTAQVDLGVDLFGQQTRFVARPTGTVVFAAGPVRANLGMGAVLAVGPDGPVAQPVAALDLWVRL